MSIDYKVGICVVGYCNRLRMRCIVLDVELGIFIIFDKMDINFNIDLKYLVY